MRSDFHGAILKQLSPRVRTFTSKRLVSYETSSPFSLNDSSEHIRLNFKDGSTATCDILIGADGVKSAVRGCIFEGLAKEAENEGDTLKAEELRGHVKAKFSGATVYRTLIPAEVLRKVSPEHRSLSGHAFVSVSTNLGRRESLTFIRSFWERTLYVCSRSLTSTRLRKLKPNVRLVHDILPTLARKTHKCRCNRGRPRQRGYTPPRTLVCCLCRLQASHKNSS